MAAQVATHLHLVDGLVVLNALRHEYGHLAFVSNKNLPPMPFDAKLLTGTRNVRESTTHLEMALEPYT